MRSTTRCGSTSGIFDLPPIEVPEADLTGKVYALPLLDSCWSFTDQSKALIDSKAYRLGGG